MPPQIACPSSDARQQVLHTDVGELRPGRRTEASWTLGSGGFEKWVLVSRVSEDGGLG